jgi:signal transduction histidine kinase
MLTSYEQRKLLMESFYLKPRLAIPLPGEFGEVAGIALHNEIRVLQQTNDRLQEQLVYLKTRNDELDAYAHTVAHDLKNPMTIIIAACDVVSHISDLSHQELMEFLQQIRSTSYEMDAIIDNLLLLSEIQKAQVPMEPINMAMVIVNVRKRLNKMIIEYQGHITFPRTWPSVNGYAPWIEEVWVNYISNALKYGGQPPRIKLGISPLLDGMVRFWISDHGPGITPAEEAQLFSPFTQLGDRHESGHGLGLSIVRRIVEKLGGQVGVESQVGKGSLFYFTLPANLIQ